ncbi:hypothetical protein DJ568_14280 [Mucilaginibacter hurinus]|uniref:Pectate lyase superfamily protein domain-containing protein n=1 Tax=Mucilaginibacter hurinus TaxID=2201324 RepID=A0A367GKQ5_9SPHI|nr:right-handed parallel beta-helix repeat-containing protein [Mucilaginibacter hurinus]RCH54049.1 hypothetical protein DJ568_14280 [Mucilaginibacter hurinus]
MKKFLYFLLVAINMNVSAQTIDTNSLVLPTPTPPLITPEFRMNGASSNPFHEIWAKTGDVWNRWYTASELNVLLKVNLAKTDSTVATVNTMVNLQDYTGKATSVLVEEKNRGGLFTYVASGLTIDSGVVRPAIGKGSGFWVRQMSDDFVNLRWFGARGDSTINDGEALIAAYKYCIANDKSLYINAGKYIIDNNVVISQPFTMLTDGPESVIFIFPGGINTGTGPGSTRTNGITIRGTKNVNIGGYTCRRLRPRGVSATHRALTIDSSENVTIGHIKVYGRGNIGVAIRSGSKYIKGSTVEVFGSADTTSNSGQGVFLENVSFVSFDYIYGDSTKSALDVNKGCNNLFITRIVSNRANDDGVEFGSMSNSYIGSILIKDMFKYQEAGLTQNNNAVDFKVENINDPLYVFKGTRNNYIGLIAVEGNCTNAIILSVGDKLGPGDKLIHDNYIEKVTVVGTPVGVPGVRINDIGYNNTINNIDLNVKSTGILSTTAGYKGLSINSGRIRSTSRCVYTELGAGFAIKNVDMATSGASEAILCNRGDSLIFVNNVISSPSNHGIYIQDGAGNYLPKTIIIKGNTFNNIGSNAIKYDSRNTVYDNIVGLSILGNVINSSNVLANVTLADQFAVSVTNFRESPIVGITINGNNLYAPALNSFKGIRLSGNYAANVSNNNIYNITTDLFTGNVGAGGYYQRGADNISWANNRVITSLNNSYVESSVTTTELGYISGLTSPVQSQLNNKVNSNSDNTFTRVNTITNQAFGIRFERPGSEPVGFSIGRSGIRYFDFYLNSSSNLQLRSLDNVGVIIGDVWNINRLTRVVSFGASPTAPTPAPGTNNTQLATTEFVISQTPASAKYIASGTGGTTVTIPHGRVGVTSNSVVLVQPANQASAGVSYVTADASNINIFYDVAPASGTDNLSYNISITP